LLRNYKWTLMRSNFNKVLALVTCCMSLTILYVFTPLYRSVKETLYNASTSKRVVWSLIKSPIDLFPDLVIVLWRSNFKSIPSLEEHLCRHSCCSCTSRHKDRVVEIVVVHFVQLSFFNILQRISIQWLQNLLN